MISFWHKNSWAGRHVLAICDNFNDMSMIMAGWLGVGIANSIAGIIPECDVITEADCDRNAVAEVIENTF